MRLSAATNITTGYSTPFDLKYKADFAEMKLMCDGSEVVPLRRNKTEIDRELPFEGTPVMADEEFDRAREEIRERAGASEPALV